MDPITAKPHTRWPVSLGLGVGASLVVAFIVIAFLWPTKTMSTQNLPVGVVGDQASVAAVEAAANKALPGAIEFIPAADRDAAVEQILTRETYGAVILDITAPEVITAQAASTASAQMLAQLAAQMQAQFDAAAADPTTDMATVPDVAVTPLVPLSEADPTGGGIAGAALPIAMGGMLGGVLISLLVVGPVRRLVALGAFGVAAGLLASLVLHTWFGFLQGGFWITAAALGLGIAATSAIVVGFASLLGRAGIGIGAVLTLFVANPISAAAVPWEFIAQPWGAVGQYLVPGAANHLVRSISYFPEASNATQWLVLLSWAAVGIALTFVGHFRNQEPVHVPDTTLEHDPAPASGN